MAYSDPEIIRHLNNLAVDAELSANYVAAKVLREAAARLTILTEQWHPSVSDGVTIANPFESEHHKAFMRVVDDIMGVDHD
jgi:hypothetical protein